MQKMTADEEKLVALLRKEPHKFNEYRRKKLPGVVIDLSKAIITRVNFCGTELPGAKFTGTEITDTSFIEANLLWTDFRFARITGKIHPATNTFEGANLFETDFFKTKFE